MEILLQHLGRDEVIERHASALQAHFPDHNHDTMSILHDDQEMLGSLGENGEGAGKPPADAVQFKVGVQRVLKGMGGLMASAHMLHVISYDVDARTAVLSCEADELTMVRAALTCYEAKSLAVRVERTSAFLMGLAAPRFPTTR